MPSGRASMRCAAAGFGEELNRAWRNFSAGAIRRRCRVGIYPTVTRRTVGDALAIVAGPTSTTSTKSRFTVISRSQIPSRKRRPPKNCVRLSAPVERVGGGAPEHNEAFARRKLLSRRIARRRRTRFAHPVKRKFRRLVAAMMAPMDRDDELCRSCYDLRRPGSLCRNRS